MSVSNPMLDNPLERAAVQLRDICQDHEHLAAPFDSKSLARMLVHIGNINRAVLESTQHHLNASKRLHDFAVTLGRIAKHFAPKEANLATRMTNVANTLEVAGAELAGNPAIPEWRAVVRNS